MYPTPPKCSTKRRRAPEVKFLPSTGPEGEKIPSHLVGKVYKLHEYPPLLASTKTWTKAVPFKDTLEYYKPTETIGK